MGYEDSGEGGEDGEDGEEVEEVEEAQVVTRVGENLPLAPTPCYLCRYHLLDQYGWAAGVPGVILDRPGAVLT